MFWLIYKLSFVKLFKSFIYLSIYMPLIFSSSFFSLWAMVQAGVVWVGLDPRIADWSSPWWKETASHDEQTGPHCANPQGTCMTHIYVKVMYVVLVNLNEFSAISWKVQHSHSRQTTSNLLRIALKGKLRVSKQWSPEGAMYINLRLNYQGPPRKFFFGQFIKILMVSDKTNHKAL